MRSCLDINWGRSRSLLKGGGGLPLAHTHLPTPDNVSSPWGGGWGGRVATCFLQATKERNLFRQPFDYLINCCPWFWTEWNIKMKQDGWVLNWFCQFSDLHWRRSLTKGKHSKRQHTLYGIQHIHINLALIHCTFQQEIVASRDSFVKVRCHCS